MRCASRAAGLAAGLLLLLASTAAGTTAPRLDVQLSRALAGPAVASGETGAIAVDLETGQTLYALNADKPLEPASNEKLGVTYAALAVLGAGYRFRTLVLGEGRQVGPVWQGRLVLKGYGDPTLSTAGLRELADQLARLGIRRVTGHVVGDESWFDQDRIVAGWRPSFLDLESPPLSALTVDRASRNGRLVADPALAAAAAFDRLLRARGIDARDARTGVAGQDATVLATVYSERLPSILAFMDRDSDNFTAEIVLKDLGAEVLGSGTSAAGATVVRKALADVGVPLAGVRVVDGSGLSRSDRVTARELVSLLAVIAKEPQVREIVTEALPVAGRTGTLSHRLESLPAGGLVRAKTGTTDIASALSGYVGRRYAFVVVQNGHPVDTWAARAAQDRFVQALAAQARAAARADRAASIR